MTFKKSLSVFMALMLLFGILVPCFPVMGTENDPHSHTYGDWVFDTEAGTQTKTCSCGDAITLHGTDNKVSQVAAPAVGQSYYLAANAAGVVQYFILEGSITDTVPYSLHTTIDPEKAMPVTLETPVSGNTGFQVTFIRTSDNKLLRIYCYDAKNSDGIMDTGTNAGNELAKHTFFADEVDGVKVLRKTGNNNILVAKYNKNKGAWRMLGVPEAELANEGVYPVMLVENHTHSYAANSYETSNTQHWQICDCGSASAAEDHDYVMDDTLGYGVCVCGKDNAPHDCQSADGVWHIDGDKHYQLCGKCGEKIQEETHIYDDWSFDAEKGIQSKLCTVCQAVGQTLYGTDNKVSQVVSPAVGGSYYLAANAAGALHYFIFEGSVTDTKPYSLHTTSDSELATPVVLETPVSGNTGFQITFIRVSDNKLLRIYCYDSLTSSGHAGIMDTGTNAGSELAKHTFFVDEVGGVKLLRQIDNQNVLVLKYNDAVSAWRILGVPETDLTNEGVYPVMLVENHTHDFTTGEYGHNGTQHWQICDCDSTSTAENHNFVMDETLGYGVCVCGKDQAPHDCENTDGIWHNAGEKHYQICAICEGAMNEQAHTYSDWSFDTEKGIQTRICTTGCGASQTLQGTNHKAEQILTPVVGETYHLAANASGILYYYALIGKVGDTTPGSLGTTDNAGSSDVQAVKLEAAPAGTEGFQLTYVRESDNTTIRIYCYDSIPTPVDGQPDTGTHAQAATAEKHTFFVDEVNGVTVLRKHGNNFVLAVKYFENVSVWRMLCVEEAELAAEGVYPIMLVKNHTHDFAGENYGYSDTQHWHVCDCGKTTQPENHNYIKNETTGDEACLCGKALQLHECVSGDGSWYIEDGKHYQLCGLCGKRFREADHRYNAWNFDTEAHTQNRTCEDCGHVDILHGADTKVSQVTAPTVGESYYLTANVAGKLHFFRHGTVTDTSPVSLVTTDNAKHNWAFPVLLEAPIGGNVGFQMTYTHPTTGKTTRIYCYDSVGSDGVMDTGANSTNDLAKHTFFVDEVGGVKVLRKVGNDHILVAKYNESVGAWRMLGVPESELANEGVYPVMLSKLHQHSYTDATYKSDEAGHWYVCQCGGKSDYAAHTAEKWEILKAPTPTTSGSKTGTCTVCGAKAVVEMPPMVAEGYYYLTGVVDGKTYYFRDKTGKESVEHTVPFSLLTTDAQENALKVDVQWDEQSNTYILSYTVSRPLNIYMGDVAGSIIKEKDGHVDLSASATTNEALVRFRWDPVSQTFYQMEGGIRYVIGFKKMTYTDGQTQAVRMLAVPESELGGDVTAMKLQLVHAHAISEAWQGDALEHWHECSCGVKKNIGAHNITEWTVEREASANAAGRRSGVCAECGQKVVHAIPMLTDGIKAPVSGGKYYLTAVLDGVRYYFGHAPSGGSVTSTYPYSLYTSTGNGENVVTPLKVKESDGNYRMYYSTNAYHIYISTDGVGTTTKSSKALIEFQWDDENKVLYQMEDDVKHVLVFKQMRTTKGERMIRITAMPLDQALIDPTVGIARLTTNAPPKVEKPIANMGMPEDATPLAHMTNADGQEPPVDVQVINPAKIGPKEESGMSAETKGAVIAAAVFAALIVLLIVFKNTPLVAGLFMKRNLWAGLCVSIAGILLLAATVLPALQKETAPGLEKFTIVANDYSMVQAKELAVEIYEDHGINLPVVHCNEFEGDFGIYVDVTGFNSYGGYKYSISARKDQETGTGIYLNGTGYALDNAITKWTKSLKKATSYPFGVTEDVVGYEWNTGDVNMTGLGFTLMEKNSRDLYEGVTLYEAKYDSFAYGKNTAYVVVVDSDAPVELKVSAGEWDENTTPDNPGQKHTVQQHGKRLTEAGYEVLAITNAGFYDLNTTQTYIPWGMQIVDGLVKKEPNKDNPKNTDNWFAQTADGKFVISNTDGYYETYETKLSDGVGGGLVLLKNGKPCFTGVTPDYRTVVGITKGGDMVMMTISGANYAVVTQVFMDLELEMECILNLDGGGSTTMHALTEEGKLEQFICETPIEREVADAIAIVKKK